MEQQVRCKKCGRVLKSLQSIAMGMGPRCAGVTIRSGKGFPLQIKGRSGNAYATLNKNTQTTIISGDLSSKSIGRREAIRRTREERRRLFEERKSFQCGVLSQARTPLIYVPWEGGRWKEDSSGRIISHERLQEYLKKYNFI